MSNFPSAVSEAVQYGPNVKALGVHLTQGQMLPYVRAAELIHDIYGLSISPGTLVAWVAEAHTDLQGTANVIANQLSAASLAHADESGLRVAGKLHWLHIVANETLTWYGLHVKRIHALCNAHLLRELVYVGELTGQAWPKAMMDFLLSANELCQARRQKQTTFNTEDIAIFRTIYDSIIDDGEQLNPEVIKSDGKRGRKKQSIAFNLLRRFRRHADAILLFISDLAVPFTNNLGERAIRMPKVKQKISGCFRTVGGAEHFCVIRSCLDTLRKQGHGMLEVLRRAFAGNPIQPAA